jgi:hypothetical protein
MKRQFYLFSFALIVSVSGSAPLEADTFGTGSNQFAIDFVTVGSPGNAPDDFPNPAGAVPYVYRMGKYEISEQMIDKANALSGGGITKDIRGPDKPATGITWYEAAAFVNWLNISAGYPRAYKLNSLSSMSLWAPTDPGYDAKNLYRNKLATYFLPSLDEWHKAAYYDPVAGRYWDYPTGSDNVPDGIDFLGDPDFDVVFYDGASNPGPNNVMDVGLASPYGTFGQGGNVYEWDETAFDRVNNIANEQRAILGGAWISLANILSAQHTGGGIAANFEFETVGIRIASRIPEPNCLIMATLGHSAILPLIRRHRRQELACRSL